MFVLILLSSRELCLFYVKLKEPILTTFAYLNLITFKHPNKYSLNSNDFLEIFFFAHDDYKAKK